MNKKLYILMSPPGGGKSTYAKELKRLDPKIAIVSADHYFTKEDGVYEWKKDLAGVAHKICEQKASSFMATGIPVVVDNNNCKLSEFSFYLRLAETFGYEVEFVIFVVILDDAENLFKRNLHNVPLYVIERRIQELHRAITDLKRNMRTAYPNIKYTVTHVVPFQETSNG